MKLEHEPKTWKASALADKYGITIAEARKLKNGEDVDVTKSAKVESFPMEKEVTDGD